MNGVDAQIKRMLNELITSTPPSIALEDVQRTDNWLRGRGVGLAVSVSLVLVGLLAAYVVGPGQAPDPSGSESPRWYQDVTGLLPESYSTIAIADLDETNVQLVAIDVTTGTALDMRISKVPIAPDPSGADLPHFFDDHGEWFEFDDGANLTTVDGRQAQVACSVLTSPQTRCSEVPGYSLGRQQIRDITASLADTLTPARVAGWPAATPVSVTTEQIDAVVAGLEPRLARLYAIPLGNGLAVAYSTDGVTEALNVSITTGYIGNDYPLTIDATGTAELRGQTLVRITRSRESGIAGTERIANDLLPTGS